MGQPPNVVSEDSGQGFSFGRDSIPVGLPEDYVIDEQGKRRLKSSRERVRKSVAVIPTNQDRAADVSWGEVQEHPHNFEELHRLLDINETHAAAVQAKAAALTGLGFRSPKIAKVLDELTEEGFQTELNATSLDFIVTGNGALEVTSRGGSIKGIRSLPAADIKIATESASGVPFHYEYQAVTSASAGASSDGIVRFCAFGQKEQFIARMRAHYGDKTDKVDADAISEVIFFADRIPTKDAFYGWPTYLSALQYIDKSAHMSQHESDFFLNRCVPEFLLFLLGRKIDKPTMDLLCSTFGDMKGLGNQFRSGIFNLPDAAMRVEAIKLGLEASGDGQMMAMHRQSTVESILSAHMLPGLLAMVQSGKKNPGATNEFPNALQAFQILWVALKQRYFSQVLARTFGKDPRIPLEPEDFMPEGELEDQIPGMEGMPRKIKPGTHYNGFRTLLDEIDINQADTLSRMKQTPMQAKAEGRDLSKGLKKKGGDSSVKKSENAEIETE